jgi:alpha-ketoglutarate-dependent taurine dioxygenase
VKISQSSPALGALITEFGDLTALTEAEAAELGIAFRARHLLIFRGREISLEEHIAVCSLFSPPVDEKSDGNLHYTYTNRTVPSRPPLGRLLFHSDYAYAPIPLGGISLYNTEVPSGGTTTVFANAERAWELLPKELRDEIRGKTSRNVLENSKDQFQVPAYLRHSSQTDPQTSHPIAFKDPFTGNTTVYLSELMSEFIDDIPRPHSDHLTESLRTYLYGEGNIYKHAWHLNDLAVWNNIALQHARFDDLSAGDDPGSARSFRRITFACPGKAVEMNAWMVQNNEWLSTAGRAVRAS